jgi:hypothetical protein
MGAIWRDDAVWPHLEGMEGSCATGRRSRNTCYSEPLRRSAEESQRQLASHPEEPSRRKKGTVASSRTKKITATFQRYIHEATCRHRCSTEEMVSSAPDYRMGSVEGPSVRKVRRRGRNGKTNGEDGEEEDGSRRRRQSETKTKQPREGDHENQWQYPAWDTARIIRMVVLRPPKRELRLRFRTTEVERDRRLFAPQNVLAASLTSTHVDAGLP